jgi:hypothetical protein
MIFLARLAISTLISLRVFSVRTLVTLLELDLSSAHLGTILFLTRLAIPLPILVAFGLWTMRTPLRLSIIIHSRSKYLHIKHRRTQHKKALELVP